MGRELWTSRAQPEQGGQGRPPLPPWRNPQLPQDKMGYTHLAPNKLCSLPNTRPGFTSSPHACGGDPSYGG